MKASSHRIRASASGQNGRMITNFLKLVVPGVPPAPQPYNGQFIQLDVTDVVEVK